MSSIRDVAKRAGVAACTVSRVLNGTAFVAPETKQKIEEAMEELNYIPNELARGMFRQKAGIVAMLVPSIKHPFFSTLADNIEQNLYEKGYKLMLCSTMDDENKEKEYLNFLKSNIVDGVIMAVNLLSSEEYSAYEKPMIMLDYYVNDKTPLIVSDHKMGGHLAAEEFIKNQCKYVIHLCNEENSDKVVSFESHKELEKRLNKSNIYNKRVSIKWNSFDFKGYQELAEYILESYPKVDGIMAADMPAVAFLKAARKIGKKIPEELCVVAYDGTYAVEMSDLHITTIVQPIEEIGKEVVETIIRQIEKKPLDKLEVCLPVKIIHGSTTSSTIS